jgi:hypothetical protein
VRCAVILWVAASVEPTAFPVGPGVLTFGNPVPGTSDPSTRQIVRMEGGDGHLVGRPHLGPLAVIAAYAPGCAPNEIVIQEKATGGNGKLLQIVAPSCLRQNLVQATLFLRAGTARVWFEEAGGGWVECRRRLTVPPRPTSSRQNDLASPLPAVILDHFGLFQLLDEHAEDVAPAGLRLSWTADLRTRISRSVWHLLWPGVALVIIVLISWSIHKLAILDDRV